jgi:hypothetical protein
MITARDILDRLGDRSRIRLSRSLGLSKGGVQRWYERNSIPSKYDRKLIAAAAACGVTVTLDELADARSELTG